MRSDNEIVPRRTHILYRSVLNIINVNWISPSLWVLKTKGVGDIGGNILETCFLHEVRGNPCEAVRNNTMITALIKKTRLTNGHTDKRMNERTNQRTEWHKPFTP